MFILINLNEEKDMRFCGIDASSKKTGMCLLIDGELSDYILLDFSSYSNREERMDLMCKAILKQLSIYNPSITYIEDSWNAANVEVTKLLTRIMGVTYAWCLSKGREWHSILPSQWRKYCGITQSKKKRQELKQESINYVKDKFGIDVNDDVADSICLATGVCNYFMSLQEENNE